VRENSNISEQIKNIETELEKIEKSFFKYLDNNALASVMI
jgi:hypothetical protein